MQAPAIYKITIQNDYLSIMTISGLNVIILNFSDADYCLHYDEINLKSLTADVCL